MRRIGRLGQLVLLGLFAHSAHAAEQATPGWYFGASGGAATHDVSKGGAQDTIVIILGFGGSGGGIIAVPRTTLDTDSDSTGWRGLAGYRFHRSFAAELEYLDFGSSHIHETYFIDDTGSISGSFSANKDFTTDVSGPAVSGLGKLPVGAHLELFLRAGVLFAESKVRAEGFTVAQGSSANYSDRVLFGGVGVDWNFAGRWSARLEYERSKAIERNADIAESHIELLSLGVLFRL